MFKYLSNFEYVIFELAVHTQKSQNIQQFTLFLVYGGCYRLGIIISVIRIFFTVFSFIIFNYIRVIILFLCFYTILSVVVVVEIRVWLLDLQFREKKDFIEWKNKVDIIITLKYLMCVCVCVYRYKISIYLYMCIVSCFFWWRNLSLNLFCQRREDLLGMPMLVTISILCPF